MEDRDRIRAAEAILDRGYGKPSQAIIQVPASKRQAAILASMSDDQLVAIIEKKELPRLTPAQPMVTVEAATAALKAEAARTATKPSNTTASISKANHGPADDIYADDFPIVDELLT